jgi:Flp pilus assembly protein TadG
MRLRKKRVRPAATMVEFALVGSITFLLLLGLLIGGLGIFRYQQVARLARDGSRWASVHGTDYAKDTNNPAATASDVFNTVISPNATGLDPAHLTYSVTWNAANSPYSAQLVNGQMQNVANTVTVTITYQWVPEAYLGGITLSSTSTTVMSY